MNKMVSIIIPVYNGSNYMKEAIDSALNQTYSNIEVIVVNDGSDDNNKTKNVALSYGNKIRYFEKVNGGVSTALNLAIRNMKGEYFSWLSHDDIYHKNKIAAQIESLKKTGDMMMPVYSGWEKLSMPERVASESSIYKKRYSMNFFGSGLCAVTMGFISGCSLLIHKSYFDKYGLFDEGLRTTQDYAKWFEMFKDRKMLYIEEPLIQSRVHLEQTGVTYKNFHNECDELYYWMLKNVTYSDTMKMGWDLYHFYSIILPRLYTGGLHNTYQYICEQLLSLKETPNTNEKIEELRKFLDQGSSQIYLYCAGRRGQALLNYLNLRGIVVEGFCDSQQNFWGTYIKQKKCFSPNDIDKEKALLIVTKADPEALKDELTRRGFKHVITYDEIEEYLCEIPASKKCLLKHGKDFLI